MNGEALRQRMMLDAIIGKFSPKEKIENAGCIGT